MRRFKNILFFANPLRDAEAALRQAMALYDAGDARITLVEVAREVPSSLVKAGIVSENIRKELLAERQEKAEALVEKVAASSDIEVKLLSGTPFIEVIREVIGGDYDLLIKPSGGGGKLTRLLGSTDMHLLRKCPCPVWLVKPTRKRKHKRILAAVDPDPYMENARLNRLILELARSMSEHHRAELHVVAAWELWGESALRMRQHQTKLDSLRKDMKKANRHWLKELTASIDKSDVDLHVHLVEGRPSDIILEQAEKLKADLIVMGTLARAGIPGLLMGNTAERVLSEVDCSVLTAKPAGFESPVAV